MEVGVPSAQLLNAGDPPATAGNGVVSHVKDLPLVESMVATIVRAVQAELDVFSNESQVVLVSPPVAGL